MGCAWRNSSFRNTHDKAWDHLIGHEPDIALVQEACIPHSLFKDPTWHVMAGYAVPNEFGSCIVSRFSLRPFEIDPVLRSVLGRHLAVAQACFDGTSVCHVASVHAAPRQVEPNVLPAGHEVMLRRGAREVWYSDVAFTLLARSIKTGSPFLFGGDWNEAREWDTIHGPGGGGVEFFERAGSWGWLDSLRHSFPKEQQTWLGDGHPYEDDHLFCDEALYSSLSSCEIDGDVRDLSDHALLSFTFNTQSSSSPA
jgi:exonuclease III